MPTIGQILNCIVGSVLFKCAMIANGILDLVGTKRMFNSVKNEYVLTSEDQDLTDHLDPDISFEIDVGGQG